MSLAPRISAMDIEFDDLVQSSDKMLMELQGDADLPLITRSLKQMRQCGERAFKSRGSQVDVRAARLLGSKLSYELPINLSAKLDSINVGFVPDRSVVLPDIDIHTFLKNEQENALLKSFEDTQRSTYIEVDVRNERIISSWWEQEKLAILSSLASTSDPLDNDLQILHGSPNDLIEKNDTFYDEFGRSQPAFNLEELCYARQLERYLSMRLQKKPNKASLNRSQLFPDLDGQPSNSLLFYLSEAIINAETSTHSSQVGKANTTLPQHQNYGNMSEMGNIWTLLRLLVDNDNLLNIQASFVSECSISTIDKAKCESTKTIEMRSSNNLQASLINWSLSYLESEFISFMRATVSHQPAIAKLGGQPGTRALIRAYINVRWPWTAKCSTATTFVQDSSTTGGDGPFEYEDGLVDSKPVWMMIYFCLRAGDLKDAIEIARSATNNLGDFYLTLSEFSKNNRKIPAHLLPTIIEHYNRSVKNSTDFYKRCVFCVLCRFDLDDLHLSVARSVDDFLWLRLSQVELLTGHTQLKATPNHSHLKKMTKQEDVLCLASLQSLISETYGEAHFDAWHQPLLYFKILLLTQQFEAALAFLGRFDAFRSHSVHVALALHDLGLLVPSLTVQASTISRIDSDPPGFHRLNLARLLLLYTRKFELTNPREALNYYYFLSGIHLTNSSSKQPSHFSAMGASSAGGLLYLLGAPGLKWPLERGTDTGGCLPLQKKDVTDDDSEELTDDEDDEDRFRGGLHGKGIIYFSEKSLFVLCTCELALATKEFTTLFGYLDESGLRKPGAIDRFCPNEAACEQLIVYIAKRVEATGQLVHAVRLYQLAAAICSSAISTTSSDFFVHSMPRHPSSAANMLDLILDERRRHHLISATRLVNSLLVNALVTGAMGVSVPTGSVWTEEVLSTGQMTGGHAERGAILQLATELATRLHDCPISNSPFAGRPSGPYSHLTSNWSTALPSPDSDEAALFYLLDLATFFDMARAGRWQAAIQHMDQLGLLPSTTIESTSSSPGLGVDQCVALFSRLSDCVRRPLAATAILCLMRCLVASANSLILGPGLGHDSSEILHNHPDAFNSASTNSGVSTLAELRDRAKALISFTGRIPYRLPGDVYAKLTQMEMELM